jgi:hypothetical protein
MDHKVTFLAGCEHGMDFTLRLVSILLGFGALSGYMCYPGSCIGLMLGAALGMVASFYLVERAKVDLGVSPLKTRWVAYTLAYVRSELYKTRIVMCVRLSSTLPHTHTRAIYTYIGLYMCLIKIHAPTCTHKHVAYFIRCTSYIISLY